MFLVETGEGRVFTICKRHWLFVYLAPDGSLLNGLEGGVFGKNPDLNQGLMMIRIMRWTRKFGQVVK